MNATTKERSRVKFPPLTYGHAEYGSNQFWIGTGPADPPICHVNYTVERNEWRHSLGDPGPLNAEGWAKLFAAAPDLLRRLQELLVAVEYKGPPVDFGKPGDPNPCFEARIPIGFVEAARNAIASAGAHIQ